MNVIKRSLTLSVVIGAPLVCGAVFAIRIQAGMAAQGRSHALNAAVNADRPDEVRRLLASGADPNLRELPPDTRTLWQKIGAMWRPVKREGEESSLPLTLALRRAFTENHPAPPEIAFAIIKALHNAGAREEGRFWPGQGSIEQAEQDIKDTPDTPLAAGSPAHTFTSAEDTMTDFLKSEGMSARAMADWAECRFRKGRYADAARAYRLASLWQNNDANLQARLAQAEQYQRLAETIRHTLPAGREVFFLRPYLSAANPSAWAALYGVGANGGLERGQIGLYQVKGANVREVCHTSSKDAAWTNDAYINQATLYVFPMTGRAAPEIVVRDGDCRSVVQSSVIALYSYTGGRLISIAYPVSAFRSVVEKAPHGAGYILRQTHETGLETGDVGMALRSDYYAFNGKRYAFADAQFPDACRDYIKEVEFKLRRDPCDYDLLQNLADMYSITGDAQKSEQNYRKAERVCRQAIANRHDSDTSEERGALEQIMARDPERYF